MRASRLSALAWGSILVLVAGCASTAPSVAPGASAPTASPSAAAPATASPQASTAGSPEPGPVAGLPDVPFYRGDPLRSAIEPGPGPIAEPVVAWETELGAGGAVLNPILVGGLVITGTNDDVIALDGLTGAEVWRASAGGGRLDGSIGSADGVVVVGAGERIMGLNAADGDKRWDVDVQSSLQRPTIVDGTAYVGTNDGLVIGIDIVTGARTWSWQGPRGLQVRVDVVDDGVAYVTSNDGRLFTVSVPDGTEGWTYQSQAERAVPSKVGDTVFVSSGLGDQSDPVGLVVALDAATGDVRWRFAPPSGEQAVHGAARDGIVFVTTRADGMYALRDLGTSVEVVWHTPDVPHTDWPGILVGDVVYVQTRDDGLLALNASDGRILWQVESRAGARGPIVSGGRVYATLDEPGRVIAWAEPAIVAAQPSAAPDPSAPTPTDGPATAANPLTITRTIDRSIVDVELGTLDDGWDAVQAAVDGDGRLVVIGADAVISVIDPATGRTLHRWGGEGHGDGKFDGAHDVAIAPDGSIYAVDEGGRRVQVFDAEGTFLRQVGSFGTGLGQFSHPSRIAIAPDGSLYVKDGATITRFAPNGDVAWRVGGRGDPDPRLARDTYDLAVLPDGRILVTLDPGGPALVLDAEDGSVIGPWGPDDIGASGEPEVAPDGTVWMYQYVPSRIDAFTASGERLGTVLPGARDADIPPLYPTPVFTDDGRGWTFSVDAGLVELASDLPGG